MMLRGGSTEMWVLAWGLVTALVLSPGPGMHAAVPSADFLLTNGKIITLDRKSSIVHAVAIGQGRIMGAGTDNELRQYMGQTTRVIDLHGRTVIPGLIDSHMHAIRQGLTWNDELHWQTVKSLAQALTMIRDKASRTPPGTWIVVAGGWHESQFAENRKPTLEEIESISTDHPIWVQYLYNEAMMNKAAIKLVGLSWTDGQLRFGPVDARPIRSA